MRDRVCARVRWRWWWNFYWFGVVTLFSVGIPPNLPAIKRALRRAVYVETWLEPMEGHEND